MCVLSGQALNRWKMSEIKYILENCRSSLLILKCDKFWNWVILVLFYLFLLKHFSLCMLQVLWLLCTYSLPSSSLTSHAVCGLRTHLSKSCSEDRRLHFPMGFPTSSKHKSPPWVLHCHSEGKERCAWLRILYSSYFSTVSEGFMNRIIYPQKHPLLMGTRRRC